MSEHEAAFKNIEPKYGFQKNDRGMIRVELTPEDNIKVTILRPVPAPDPIIYDKNEDFHKNWKILSTIDR